MIIEFSITNFRSIKGTQTFSMLPSSRVKERKNPLQTASNYPDLEVFPLAVIYGGNNTGKSNLIKAFFALQWLVTNSHNFNVGKRLEPNESFLFDIKTQQSATIFELDFIAGDSKRYLYVIEFSSTLILREELYYHVSTNNKKSSKRRLFIRSNNTPIEYGDDFKGAKKNIEERLIENMLFLSKAVQENNKSLRPVFDFFTTRLEITQMSENYVDFQISYFGHYTTEKAESTELLVLNKALQDIDTGILYLEIKKHTIPDDLFEVKEVEGSYEKKIKTLNNLRHQIKAVHRLFDGKQEIGKQEISLREESEGTRKFIALFTKLMDLCKFGGVFIVDELERSLHPLLTKALFEILLNPETNPKQAQLIFTSHDTTFIDYLDKDQINILEKDKYGATEIYALSDIKGLRNDIPLNKWYLSGKLGGVPNINTNDLKADLKALHGTKG